MEDDLPHRLSPNRNETDPLTLKFAWVLPGKNANYPPIDRHDQVKDGLAFVAFSLFGSCLCQGPHPTIAQLHTLHLHAHHLVAHTPCLAGPLPPDEVEQVADPLPPPQRFRLGLRMLDHTLHLRGGGLCILESSHLTDRIPVNPRDVAAAERDFGLRVLLPRPGGNSIVLELDRYEGIICAQFINTQ